MPCLKIAGMQTTSPQPPTQLKNGKATRFLLWILLFLAAGEFIVRGPARYLRQTGWNDLAQNYAASRLWLRGQNFANPENFVRLWKEEVGVTLSADTIRTHLAPPPGTLILLAPIAILPWHLANLAWLTVLVTSVGLTIWSLARAAGLRSNEPGTLGFVAFCLALAPFHTGTAAANETILVVTLCALGILAAGEDRDVVAGLLFGAACSLKPHLGSFLVLYYLIRMRWRLFSVALGFTALLAAIAALWMRICGVAWVHDYFHNVNVLATQNKIDDFTSANSIRFMLINLQVPLYSFTHSARSANIIALGTGVIVISVWIYLVIRAGHRQMGLLALATIAVIGLLPLYHRLYDASLLAIPLCWCMSELVGARKTVARMALVPLAAFLVPGAALLQQLERSGRIPQSWTSSWWWEGVVMPHQTWLLCVLALILLYGLATFRQTAELAASERI